MRKIFSIFISVFFILIACQRKVYYSKEVRNWKQDSLPDTSQVHILHTVYLLGDAGAPNLNTVEPNFKLLKSFLEKDSNSTLIFLGDNIYHDGLPPEGNLARNDAERKIKEQMNIVENYKGNVLFIAGNHDWDYMKAGGYKAILRQEKYVQDYLNRGNSFVPDSGCPGPFKKLLSKDLVLIAIDSQWWLHDEDKPYGGAGDCSAEDESDLITQLEDFIQSNKNKNILVVAHHPLYSNGNHGGFYSVVDHIFPLRLIRSSWYIPLPVIGSIYPLHRKFGGSAQDIPHYRYQEYKNQLLSVFEKYDNITYAAGHDHNLQYHVKGNLRHIISGSGSKINHVKPGEDAYYIQQHKGFARTVYYSNGEAWVEYWIPEGDGSRGTLAFRTKLYDRKSSGPDLFCGLSDIDYSDSTITAAAGNQYKRGNFSRAFFGRHYRAEWSTPIEFKYLDFKAESGGLIPYGKGGGKQSLSLKMKDLEGHEFTIRSIKKDVSKVVPEELKNSFLHDLVQDQISAQHPYGALTIPPMAKAIGILHTNPRLVVVPNDSCLGPYREDFKNMLGLFEEDPDESHEDIASLGYSKNIVGTDKALNEFEEDNDNQMALEEYMKVRLFDMFVGDWDRHQRQYRWAEFKTNNGKFYRPIAEDRDQVYFNFDGILPFLISRKWSVRNLKNFNYEIRDVRGLNLSAIQLDRRLLSGLTEDQWIQTADSLKVLLTDSVIEKAIHVWPEEIFAPHGDEIIAKLKSRREQLPGAARTYYKALAKYVDLYGSDKYEIFDVQRIDRNKTIVSIYKSNKEGEKKKLLYERTFDRKETKEIRLYGLDGNDKFIITGKVTKGIKIRIIGGGGNDTIADHSRVQGPRRRLYIYDTRKGNHFDLKDDVNKELAIDSEINEPLQDKFHYNFIGPQLLFLYNQDDGFFLGGGALYKGYKFRKQPYGTMTRFVASRATQTESYYISFQNEIKGFIGKMDFMTNIKAYAPVYVMNYFGYGNKTELGEKDVKYHRVRLNYTLINPSFNRTINKFLTVGIGPKYESFAVKRIANTYLDEVVYSTNKDVFDTRKYIGLRTFFRMGASDSEINPTRGIMLTGEYNFNKSLSDHKGNYSKILSEFKFYITPNLPYQLTFAGRAGFGLNYGSYEFYQANMLSGGNTIDLPLNLRGYRKTRFIGDYSFYQNAEIRMQVLKFNLYLLTGKLGVMTLLDNGRVWARNERSKEWHTGVGGGLWINIFNRFVLSQSIAFSKEGHYLNFKSGFFF